MPRWDPTASALARTPMPIWILQAYASAKTSGQPSQPPAQQPVFVDVMTRRLRFGFKRKYPKGTINWGLEVESLGYGVMGKIWSGSNPGLDFLLFVKLFIN